MKTPRLTIYEIARKANVSIATVSRAVNPETRHKVASATAAKIEALVERHRYTPNLAARSLTRLSYRTLGVIFPHHSGILLSDYYSRLVSGIADRVLESDYRLKMILIKAEKPKWDNYDFQNGEGVDGLIFTYWRTVFSDASVLSKLGIPCTVINNVEPNLSARFLAGDHRQGGALAAEHLYENGHRRIAVLCGNYRSPDIHERLDGFLGFWAAKRIRIPKMNIVESDYTELAAYQAVDHVLSLRPAVTALFCMSDTQAFGVLNKFRDLKISCPGKISIVGYDDDRLAAAANPPLTSIRVPVYELGRMAAGNLIDALAASGQKQRFNQTVRLPVTLVERKSVRPVK